MRKERFFLSFFLLLTRRQGEKGEYRNKGCFLMQQVLPVSKRCVGDSSRSVIHKHFSIIAIHGPWTATTAGEVSVNPKQNTVG